MKGGSLVIIALADVVVALDLVLHNESDGVFDFEKVALACVVEEIEVMVLHVN